MPSITSSRRSASKFRFLNFSIIIICTKLYKGSSFDALYTTLEKVGK